MTRTRLQLLAGKSKFKPITDPLSYGGSLRKRRCGRRERPISSRSPIHLVFKANRTVLNGGFRSPRSFILIHELHVRYAKRFYVRTERMTVQGDHLHLIVRVSRRSLFQAFLRVFSGQIAQRFQNEGLTIVKSVTGTPRKKQDCKLWQSRPFTRVVKGYRAYVTVKNYLQLNEKEALGKIPYRKSRLSGLLREEWDKLWS